MSPGLIVVLAIVGIIFSYALISKIVFAIKEHKIIKKAQTLWSSKRYVDFLSFISQRNDLEKSIGSDQFLKVAASFPAEMFLSSLIQYGFIEVKISSKSRYNYSYVSVGSAASYSAASSEETLDIVKKKTDFYVQEGNIRDALLFYFAEYAVSKEKSSVSFVAIKELVHRLGIAITDSVVSEQLNRWHRLIKFEYDEKDRQFTFAERALFDIDGDLSKDDFLTTSRLASGAYDEVIICGYTLRFYSDSHTYFINGIRVQSVTQMLKDVDFSYANYDGISKATLNRAAARGTALHAEIQSYEENGIYGHTMELQNYLALKKKYGFSVDSCEQYLIVFHNRIPVCAGRMDLLITTANKNRAIADIKRTSSYKKDDVTKQINLYRLGFLQTYGGEITEAYCLRLREDVAQFRTVDINEQTAKELIERYVSRLRKTATSYFDILSAINT